MTPAVSRTPPAPLRGFEQLSRYWDARLQRHAVKILPGEYVVTVAGELLVTVLGSCVSACVRDPVAGVGGMNHFMLPEGTGEDRWGSAPGLGLATRYGTHAMEQLINGVLGHGGRRERLEIKVTGGGRIIEGTTDVGAGNIAFVRRFLATEQLRAMAVDVGGTQPRKVYFDPVSGQMRVRYLRALRNDTVLVRERDYGRRLASAPVAGSVDLF